MLRQVPAAMSAMDQPTFDGVNTYVVSGQARAAGVTVALAGVGGDELFAGYDTFQIVSRLERMRRLLPVPARPLASGLALRAMRDTDRARKLARWLQAREPGLSALGLRRELFSPGAIARLLGGGQPGGACALPRPRGGRAGRRPARRAEGARADTQAAAGRGARGSVACTGRQPPQDGVRPAVRAVAPRCAARAGRVRPARPRVRRSGRRTARPHRGRRG